jgi:hypothetical protein
MAESIIMNVPTPKTPTHIAPRDDRLRIQTLYFDAGLSVDQILLTNAHITRRQVYYALDNRLTPQKHYTGRYRLLDTSPQVPCQMGYSILFYTRYSLGRVS